MGGATLIAKSTAAGPLPPATRPFDLDGFPAELKRLPQWVGWVWEWIPPENDRPGRWTKVPKNPHTGANASPTNPADWDTVTEAMAAAERRGWPGVGFVFTRDDPYFGIDIDGGAPVPRRRFPTYAEPSVRGGTHLIGKASAFPHDGSGNKKGGVEVYWHSRFFACTGQPLDEQREIVDCTEVLAAWHAETFPSPEHLHPSLSRDSGFSSDETILRKASDARNGAKFDRLFERGDASGYASASEADLALCSNLAYWTQDPDQIDRLFRRSALYREKWERADYRARTIARALRRSDVYTPTFAHGAALSIVPDAGEAVDPCETQRDEIAALRTELAAVRSENATRRADYAALRDVQSRMYGILGNASLGPLRVVAAILVNQLAWRATASETPPAERGIDVPPGMMAVSVAKIAALAGVSENTAGAHLKALAERGLIRRKIETVREMVDERTGELHEAPKYTSQHFFGPADASAITPDAALALANAFAGFTTERVEQRGGKRPPRCPDHPTANVVRSVVDTCSECHRELSSRERILPPTLLEPPRGTQEDGSTNFVDHTTTVDDVTKSTQSLWIAPPPDIPQRLGVAEPSDRCAPLSLHGCAPPPDRWTDVPAGGLP